MKDTFNPIRGQRGEFRVGLNLTELGDRSWAVLSRSQELGFEPPQFKTYLRHSEAVEVWAVIFQQFHPYDADTRLVMDIWDEPLDQLRQAIGQDNEFSLMVLCNFAEHLEPAEAVA